MTQRYHKVSNTKDGPENAPPQTMQKNDKAADGNKAQVDPYVEQRDAANRAKVTVAYPLTLTHQEIELDAMERAIDCKRYSQSGPKVHRDDGQ